MVCRKFYLKQKLQKLFCVKTLHSLLLVASYFYGANMVANYGWIHYYFRGNKWLVSCTKSTRNIRCCDDSYLLPTTNRSTVSTSTKSQKSSYIQLDTLVRGKFSTHFSKQVFLYIYLIIIQIFII